MRGLFGGLAFGDLSLNSRFWDVGFASAAGNCEEG